MWSWCGQRSGKRNYRARNGEVTDRTCMNCDPRNSQGGGRGEGVVGLNGKRSLGGEGGRRRVPHGRGAVGVVGRERGSGEVEGQTVGDAGLTCGSARRGKFRETRGEQIGRKGG